MTAQIIKNNRQKQLFCHPKWRIWRPGRMGREGPIALSKQAINVCMRLDYKNTNRLTYLLTKFTG